MIPDIPKGLNHETSEFLIKLKEAVETLLGENVAVDAAMTFQDARDIGLIDKNNRRLDDSGVPI